MYLTINNVRKCIGPENAKQTKYTHEYNIRLNRKGGDFHCLSPINCIIRRDMT